MKKLALLFILISTVGWSQTFREKGLSISTNEGITSIYFKNGNSDGFYLDGEFIESYGVLKLPVEEFSTFVEDLTKASKRDNIDIVKELYTVSRFEFSEDEIFFTVGEKIGTVTKKQLKVIKNL
tara:strand:- start:33 stop:404 length:372 start_codon:yes stop_codon:yes gene_type:complete